MTESSSNLEAAARELGIQISDDPSNFGSEPVQEPAQAEEVQENVQEEVQENVQEPVENMAQETAAEPEVTEAVAEDDESSLNNEYQLSLEELDSYIVNYMSEKLGVDGMNLETIENVLRSGLQSFN